MRGRKRNFVTQADKQKAYRERKKAEKAYEAGLDALRNSIPPIRYVWCEASVIVPGTVCLYCGCVVKWAKRDGCGGKYYANSFEWSKAHPEYRHIGTVHIDRCWLECGTGAVCPDCCCGRSREDHDRQIAIMLYVGNPPLPPVSPFRKEQWERAIAAGI